MENSIRVERAKKKLTQADLAKKVNMSRQSIHGIETNKNVPNLTTAMKIAKKLGVRVDEIFKLEETD